MGEAIQLLLNCPGMASSSGSAEDVLESLGVSYEPKVLNTSWTSHHEADATKTGRAGFSDLGAVAAAAGASGALERACAEFATTTPVSHRIFKVLERRTTRRDHHDFRSDRPKIMNVIDSNRLARDAGGKPYTLFLTPH